MKNKALKYIEKYNMIEKCDSLTIGFSGGADSTALLHLLVGIQQSFQLTLKAVHLNHSIRGEEGDRDEDSAKEFAEKLGVPFFAEKIDIPALSKKLGLSIEETARQERYKLFALHAGIHGKIATGHSLSDSGETLLLNLTRGTALSGLTGIPPVRDNIIRPLLSSTRQEIEQYCALYKLNYSTDSTNLTTLYSRNKIRHLVIPVLKELNPNVENSMGTTMETLLLEENFLMAETKKTVKSLKTELGYNTSQFLKIHPALQNRVIGLLLFENNIEISGKRIAMMIKAVEQEKSGLELKKNRYLHFKEESFFIFSHPPNLKAKTSGFSYDIAIKQESFPKTIHLDPPRKLVLTMVECKDFENIANSLHNRLNFRLDCDKIGAIVKVRTRKPSDYFYPYGRNVGKSLKKLFNEAKIPVDTRDNIVVVESEGKIAFVEGFGCAHWSAGDESTKNALLIKIEE